MCLFICTSVYVVLLTEVLLRYFCLNVSLMTSQTDIPQSVIELSTGCEYMLLP